MVIRKTRVMIILTTMFFLTSCAWLNPKVIVKGPDKVRWQIEYKNGSKVDFKKTGDDVTIIVDDKKPDNIFKSFLEWTMFNASKTKVQIGD